MLMVGTCWSSADTRQSRISCSHIYILHLYPHGVTDSPSASDVKVDSHGQENYTGPKERGVVGKEGRKDSGTNECNATNEGTSFVSGLQL